MKDIRNRPREVDVDINVNERTQKDEWNIPNHIFEIKKGSDVVAHADTALITHPIPLVYLKWISVTGLKAELMSKGYGSALMDNVEKLIRDQQRLGLLYERILGAPHQAQGMYERRGWKRAPKGQGKGLRSSLLYFNAGPDAPIDQLSYVFDHGIEFIYERGERGIVDIS